MTKTARLVAAASLVAAVTAAQQAFAGAFGGILQRMGGG